MSTSVFFYQMFVFYLKIYFHLDYLYTVVVHSNNISFTIIIIIFLFIRHIRFAYQKDKQKTKQNVEFAWMHSNDLFNFPMWLQSLSMVLLNIQQ